MNGYIAFYAGKQHEIVAATIYDARQKAVAQLKIPKSKQGLLSMILVERPVGTPILSPTDN